MRVTRRVTAVCGSAHWCAIQQQRHTVYHTAVWRLGWGSSVQSARDGARQCNLHPPISSSASGTDCDMSQRDGSAAVLRTVWKSAVFRCISLYFAPYIRHASSRLPPGAIQPYSPIQALYGNTAIHRHTPYSPYNTSLAHGPYSKLLNANPAGSPPGEHSKGAGLDARPDMPKTRPTGSML